MMRRLPPFMLIALAACTAADPSANDTGVNRQAAIEAIDAANARAVAALNTGDTSAAGVIYAENVTVMSPDGQTLLGRAALDSSTRAGIASRTVPVTFDWRADSIEVHGDYAYEVGRGTSIRGADTTRTQYITFWRKDPDGVWRVHRDFTVPIRVRE